MGKRLGACTGQGPGAAVRVAGTEEKKEIEPVAGWET